MISAVGIKRILFADIDKVTADITPEIAKTLIQAAIAAKDEVLNVHGETWQIEETEASVTGYKNQLTGREKWHQLSLSDNMTGRQRKRSWVAMLFRQHLKMWVGSVLWIKLLSTKHCSV